METIGLIPSQQTRANTTSTLYLKKGEPLTSPINVISEDLTKQLTISESNFGTASITNVGDVVISVSQTEGEQVSNVVVNTLGSINNPASFTVQSTATLTTPGTGPLAIIALSNDEQTYRMILASESEEGYNSNDLMIYSYPQGLGSYKIMDANAQGNAIVLGDSSTPNGCLLQVDGSQGLGQVFDNLYNRPPPVQFIWDTQVPQNLGASGAITVDNDNVISSVILDDNSGSGTVFIDNPGQTAIGDTYGIRFTASPGMTVRICSPSGLPLGNLVDGISSAFVPVVNTVYWFSCYTTDTFRYVGKMEASVP